MNNIYFLVEGKTERKVYPQWLQYLLPNFVRVKNANDAIKNNYYLISGNGYPCIIDNHLKNSIAEINECGLYDRLILVVDSDDMTVAERIKHIHHRIQERNIVINPNYRFDVVVQEKCVDTWFLGNKKVCTRNPRIDSSFYPFMQHYDVSQLDPELMIKPANFKDSTSIYHSLYLKEMLAEKNIRYTKEQPKEVGKEYFLTELKKRINETSHLASLNNFLNFCEQINNTNNNTVNL